MSDTIPVWRRTLFPLAAVSMAVASLSPQGAWWRTAGNLGFGVILALAGSGPSLVRPSGKSWFLIACGSVTLLMVAGGAVLGL